MSIHILCFYILLLVATCYPTAIPKIMLTYLADMLEKESIIVIIYSEWKSTPIKLRYVRLRKSALYLVRDFVKYSIPVMCSEILWSFGGVTSIAVLDHMGVSVISANSVVQTIKQLTTIVAFGVANSAAILLGQMIGNEKYEDSELYASRFLKITVVVGFISCILINCTTKQVVQYVDLNEKS